MRTSLIGRIDVPASVRVFQVGADWVLGRWRGPDDVDHVRLYRMGPAGM